MRSFRFWLALCVGHLQDKPERATPGGIMKKFSIALLAMAATLAITPAALADTYTYTYTFTDGSLVATGTLTGYLVAPGEYDITSGTIDLSGTSFNGTGIFVPVQPNGNFYDGGGTIITFTPLPDTDLFPGSNPQIDNNGAFTFDITSGPGVGNGLAIWSNGPGIYGGVGGSWSFMDNPGSNGSFDAVYDYTTVTPEPGSLLLLGTGLLGVAFVAFRKTKSSSGLVLHS
jgi:hypothetical protein